MIDLLRDLALGVNHKIAYPGEHPIIKEQNKKIVDEINSFAEEIAEISFVFLGESIIVEDVHVDLADYESVQIFVKRLKRLNVESLTFDTSCTEIDIEGFLDLVANPPRDVNTYDDINNLLIERRADKVYFNTVEFKIRTKGEGDYEGGGEGVVDIVEEEEFNLVRFLENTCKVQTEDPPSVEAEKVTAGLVKLYDGMAEASSKPDIKEREAVFEEVMGSISQEAKRFILKDKLKLKQVSSIIKSIIMSFSDEEIVEIFVNRVRLLGVFDAEDLLLNLTPERLDGILPEIRERLKMMNIEEKYISGLEKKIKSKMGKKKETEKKKGEKKDEKKGEVKKLRAGSGAGVVPGDIRSFVSKFSEVSKEDYGAEQVSTFFSSVCKLDKDDDNKAEKISEGLENFVKEFIRQFGEDNLLSEASKIRKTFKKVPDRLRKEIFARIINSKSPVKVTMAKVLLPLMDNESIVSLIIVLIEEKQREMLDGLLSSLGKEKLQDLRVFTEERLGQLGISGDEFSKLWKQLITEPQSLKKVGGVSRKAYGRLQDKLKSSMDLTDIKSFMESFYESLASESTEVRITAISNIQNLLEQLFKGEKIAVIRRIVDRLMEYARSEKNKEVYIKYTDALAVVGQRSVVVGYDFLASSIVSFFAGEVSNAAKAKIIIPRLAEFKTKEAINVLLSLLWEEDLRKIVVDKVDEFGEESIPYLMELLKDSEDKEVRFSLLKIIQSIGSTAPDIVKKYLNDKRWFVRRNAVLILGSIGNKEIIDDIYALKDDHEKVQIEIIRAIRHVLKEEAETYLLSFLDSNFSEVQKYAISILGPIISDEGVTALNKRLLLNKFSKDEGTEIKKMICGILLEKGNSQSVESLAQIIEAKKVFGIPEFSDELRFEAVKAVAEIGGVRAEGLLKTLSRDRSKKIRTFVTERLSNH
ncbi:HEAT repeat domain-containing protein [candidate division WOR-3 bacterium]|nr:HEAT repeat domain-containing protein [candidate division WOR-3 bacterium]